jgi:DNA-binding transcriptional ArsR family regulator
MIVVDLDASTVARTRLAVSPLAEAAAWLRLAVGGRRHPVFGEAGAAARSALTDPDVALVAHVMPPGGRGYLPDLLTPKPVAGGRVLDTQLEHVRETSPLDTHEQLCRLRFGATEMPRPVRRSVDDGSFTARAASGLRRFWRAAIADGWPSLLQTLQADIAEKADALARAGVGSVLGSLHPAVGWDGAALAIQMPPYDERARYVDTELVLAPSVLGWPGVAPQLCNPAQAVLSYPVRAAGAGPSVERPAALAALVGSTRSALLRDLAVPRSTTALSARHRLAPATVSYHLGVLHRAGLVVRQREQHTVLYRRTPQAEGLVL